MKQSLFELSGESREWIRLKRTRLLPSVALLSLGTDKKLFFDEIIESLSGLSFSTPVDDLHFYSTEPAFEHDRIPRLVHDSNGAWCECFSGNAQEPIFVHESGAVCYARELTNTYSLSFKDMIELICGLESWMVVHSTWRAFRKVALEEKISNLVRVIGYTQMRDDGCTRAWFSRNVVVIALHNFQSNDRSGRRACILMVDDKENLSKLKSYLT